MMYADEIREYGLNKSDAEESFPFDADTLVLKVKGKIFLLMGFENNPPQVNLKCDPEKAVLLREEYPDGVIPGYHMNKKHWNTVMVGKVPEKKLKEWIDESYELVKKGKR